MMELRTYEEYDLYEKILNELIKDLSTKGALYKALKTALNS